MPRSAAFVVGGLAVAAIAGLIFWRTASPGGPGKDIADAYAKGEYAKAATLARARLKSDPGDLELNRMLARASARLREDEFATSLYEKKIGLANMKAEDHALLSQMIARQGNSDLALQVAEKAAKDSPDHPELLDAVAQLSGQKQHLDEAAAAATKLAKLPGWEAKGQILLGIFRSRMDDYARAAEALEAGFAKDPGADVGYMPPDEVAKLAVKSLLNVGKVAEARKRIADLTAKSPDVSPELAWLITRADLLDKVATKDTSLLEKAGEFRAQHPDTPEPAPYVGSKACVACHREISEAHNASRHARTFHHGKGLLDLPRPPGPLADPDDPKTTHTLAVDGEKLRATTRTGDGPPTTSLIEFAFGTPNHYVTMIARGQDGAYRALRNSCYFDKTAGKMAWDRTSGDAGAEDPDDRVRGQAIHTRDGVMRCLACHVTNPRDFRDPGLDGGVKGPTAADRGIGCERCHGPGGAHVAAITAGSHDMAIAGLKNAPSGVLNTFCTPCHTVGEAAAIKNSPEDPRWVRSAGLTFNFTRCKQEDGSPMSCIACHDPHRDSPADPAFYDAKCLTCHKAGAKPAAKASSLSLAGAKGVPCKVNPEAGCTSCHMPKVPLPAIHSELTDHFIRIRKK